MTGEASRRESFCVTEFPDPAIRGSFPGRSEEVTAADLVVIVFLYGPILND